MMRYATWKLLGLAGLVSIGCARAGLAGGSAAPAAIVSFHRQIRPILRQYCQGCHQPALASGKLILSTYAGFQAGGDHGPAFVPGKPDGSRVIQYVSGTEPKMPQGGPPLSAAQVALLRQWVQEGGRDDTPVQANAFDAGHPPVYHVPPVISALAYSPDGKTLAVSGYCEVLLHHADGSGLIARLVGKSHQIKSLAYSPNGKVMAAVGGSPALFGEVQFWDTATKKMIHAVTPSYDTLFGASFSPDGKELAFGGADDSARVITVPDGKPVLKFDSHSDWVFGTAFSRNGKDLITASRDEALKLTVVDTGSFVDDLNTHHDGLTCLARSPKVDEVVCAGLDGVPRLYQVFRTVARTMMNEDHNLIRQFDKQPGPINAVAYSPDGSMIAVGSTGDEVPLYRVSDGQTLATLKGQTGGVFAVAFRPDGKQVATGGFDGVVRLFDITNGQLVKAFVPVPITGSGAVASAPPAATTGRHVARVQPAVR